jgi:RNase H
MAQHRFVLYTDASLGHDESCGWGCVFVDNGEALGEASGKIVVKDRNTQFAELLAIKKGLFWAVESGLLSRGRSVKISCDCRVIVEQINCPTPARKYKALIYKINCLARDHDLKILAAWIKSHQPQGQSKSGDFNRRADYLAREETSVGPSKRAKNNRRAGVRRAKAKAAQAEAEAIALQ